MRSCDGGFFDSNKKEYDGDNKTDYMYIDTTISDMNLKFFLNISYNYPDDTVETMIWALDRKRLTLIDEVEIESWVIV